MTPVATISNICATEWCSAPDSFASHGVGDSPHRSCTWPIAVSNAKSSFAGIVSHDQPGASTQYQHTTRLLCIQTCIFSAERVNAAHPLSTAQPIRVPLRADLPARSVAHTQPSAASPPSWIVLTSVAKIRTNAAQLLQASATAARPTPTSRSRRPHPAPHPQRSRPHARSRHRPAGQIAGALLRTRAIGDVCTAGVRPVSGQGIASRSWSTPPTAGHGRALHSGAQGQQSQGGPGIGRRQACHGHAAVTSWPVCGRWSVSVLVPVSM